MVLQAGDLPSGWQLFPLPLDVDIAEGFGACLVGRIDLSGLAVTAEAVSLAAEPSNSNGESLSLISSGVSVFQDEEQAAAAFARLVEAYGACVADATDELEAAGELNDLVDVLAGLVGVTVEQLEFFPALGEESAAWRIRVRLGDPELGGPDAAIEITTDIVHVRTGRVYSLLAFTGVPNTFDPALAKQLAATIAQRIPSGHEQTTRAVKAATGATDAEIAAACQLMEGTTPPPGLDDPNVKGRLLGIATAIVHYEQGREQTLAYCAAFTAQYAGPTPTNPPRGTGTKPRLIPQPTNSATTFSQSS